MESLWRFHSDTDVVSLSPWMFIEIIVCMVWWFVCVLRIVKYIFNCLIKLPHSKSGSRYCTERGSVGAQQLFLKWKCRNLFHFKYPSVAYAWWTQQMYVIIIYIILYVWWYPNPDYLFFFFNIFYVYFPFLLVNVHIKKTYRNI